MRNIGLLFGLVIVGIVIIAGICGFLILREDRLQVHTRNSRSLIRICADRVRSHYLAQGTLPERIDEITQTPPLLDSFDKPLEYRIYSSNPPQFSIRSLGITAKSNSYVFEIQGTNLVVVRVD